MLILLIPLIYNMAYIMLSMMVKQRNILNGTENKHDYTKQKMKYTYTAIWTEKLSPNQILFFQINVK